MNQLLMPDTTKVLVIHSQGMVRQAITGALRSMGFQNVRSMPTLKDGLAALDEFVPDWLVTESLMKDSLNILHFLRLAVDLESLHKIRVTLFVNPDDDASILIPAYQLGLLSHHPSPKSQDQASRIFQELISQVNGFRGNSMLTAAAFLRVLLDESEDYDSWFDMEKKILAMHPGRMDLAVNLIAPLIRLENFPRVQKIYQQLVTVGSTEATTARSIAIKMGFDPEEGVDKKSATGGLGIDHVVVVDPDEAVLNSIRSLLISAGVKDVHCFETGTMALEYLKSHPNPDLLIHEWRIPTVPGPIFLQRVRSDGSQSCPVIVVSSLIKESDRPLFREMGVAGLCTKPITAKDFLATVVWTVQQDQQPSHHSTLERKIRQALRDGKLPDAEMFYRKYCEHPEAHEIHKIILDAEIRFYRSDLDGARERAMQALRKSTDLMVLNLLGKILMNVNEHTLALKCFEKAQSISPQNIERLCMMAEAHAELGDDGGATQKIDAARKLDQDNSTIAVAEANVSLTLGQAERAKAMMGQLNNIDEVIAYTNNQAVALTKVNQLDKAIEKYQMILKAIPPNRGLARSILLYNLALALIKSGKQDEAIRHLTEARPLAGKGLKDKVQSLEERLKSAIKSGKPLKLKTSETSGQVMSENLAATGKSPGQWTTDQKWWQGGLPIKPGEHGVYLIYQSERIDPRTLKLIRSLPLKEVQFLLKSKNKKAS